MSWDDRMRSGSSGSRRLPAAPDRGLGDPRALVGDLSTADTMARLWLHTAPHLTETGSARTSSVFTVWRALVSTGLHVALVTGHRQVPPINPVGNAGAAGEAARQQLAP